MLLLVPFALATAQPPVAVISHRGEHLAHPENTLPAYRAAHAAGADYIETDVRTTVDGRLVVCHDRTVDRTTNGTGEVAKLRFRDVRRLDAGARFHPRFAGTRVPTFDEVLAFARGRIGVYIDAKQVAANALVRAVARHRMRAHVVVYGSPELLAQVARLDPELRIMPEAVSVEALPPRLAALRPKVVAFDARDFLDPVLALARQAGAGIFVDRLGPADTPEAWEDAIRRGATGIQTDRPADLVRYLRARGLHR